MNETIEASRQKLIQDFDAVVADAEKLLEALAAAGAEKGSELRSEAERSLEAARERLGELRDDTLERGRVAARAADDYVHENPWQSIGLVAAIAVLAGLVIGLLMNRR